MLKSSYVPHTCLTVLTMWSSSSSFPAKRQEIDGAWYWVGKYWGFFNSSVKRVPLSVNFLISVAWGEKSFLHRFSKQTFEPRLSLLNRRILLHIPSPRHMLLVHISVVSNKLDHNRREGETVTCNSNHFLWHLAIWSGLALLFWLLFTFLLWTVHTGKQGSNIRTYEIFHYVWKDLAYSNINTLKSHQFPTNLRQI